MYLFHLHTKNFQNINVFNSFKRFIEGHFNRDKYLVLFQCIDYNENDENDSFLSICAIENNLPIFKKRRHCTKRSTPLRIVEKNKLVVSRH